MTTIDEIMEQARHLARVTSAANRSGKWPSPEKTASHDGAENSLRHLITKAIAEARADGAREMQIDAGRMCAAQSDEADGDIAYRDACNDCAKSIRALPLPAGTVNVVMDREHGGLTFAPAKREPVRLTDGKGECDDAGHEEGRCGNASCCGQPAVLAANGLTK